MNCSYTLPVVYEVIGTMALTIRNTHGVPVPSSTVTEPAAILDGVSFNPIDVVSRNPTGLPTTPGEYRVYHYRVCVRRSSVLIKDFTTNCDEDETAILEKHICEYKVTQKFIVHPIGFSRPVFHVDLGDTPTQISNTVMEEVIGICWGNTVTGVIDGIGGFFDWLGDIVSDAAALGAKGLGLFSTVKNVTEQAKQLEDSQKGIAKFVNAGEYFPKQTGKWEYDALIAEPRMTSIAYLGIVRTIPAFHKVDDEKVPMPEALVNGRAAITDILDGLFEHDDKRVLDIIPVFKVLNETKVIAGVGVNDDEAWQSEGMYIVDQMEEWPSDKFKRKKK